MYDIAIIGAGVIGCSIARELSRYELNTIIIEKNNDVAAGTTKANSAIVHAGYDAPVDSLKGKLNVRGNEMYYEVCSELNVPFKRIGSYVIALNDEDMKTIRSLYENGTKLGINDMKIIDGDEVRKNEPNLNDNIIGALYAPSAGIVESWELAIANAENAMDNGVELKLNFLVSNIEKEENIFKISDGNEVIESEMVINVAGVFADDIYNLVADSHFEIHPRKGQYYLLDKKVKDMVKHIIFQCPTKLGKGVVVTPTVDENILLGPTSENLDISEKNNVSTTFEGLNFVREKVLNTTSKVMYKDVITSFAGLRAEPSTGDFIIEESDQVEKFINVAGIKSPGLSSAPAIAEYVVILVKNSLGEIKENLTFNPIRRKRVKFNELSDTQKNELIKENPKYGNIVCRCETITEAEIVDAIHRNAGGNSINGIKRRCRPGAGRCQGGFCGPKVLEILSRELNISPEEVVLENIGSEILTGRTKENF